MTAYPETSLEATNEFPSVEWLEVDTHERMVIREPNGLRIPIPFNRLLSDGTLLSQTVNSRFHTAIRQVVYYCRYGVRDCSVTSGHTQQAIARQLTSLASWMVGVGIYDFGQLSMTHITKYLADAANGYEALLNAPRRVFDYISRRVESGLDIKNLSFSQVRKEEFASNLKFPLAEAIFEDIKSHCRLRPFSEYEFREPAPNKPVTGTYGPVRSIQLLYILREYLDTSLSFDPFPDGLPADARTNTEGYTPTIPESAALHLLQSAVHWVMTVGPKLLALYRALRWKGNILRAPARQRRFVSLFNAKYANVIGFHVERERTSELGRMYIVHAIKRFLPIACLIVVGTFSARRRTELLTLRKDAVKGTREYGYWLDTYIGKTKRKNDLIPIPEVAALALKLMNRFGTQIRGSANKFVFLVHAYKEKVKMDKRIESAMLGKLDEKIDAFAKVTGNPYVLGPKGWAPWHYSCHQLRKLFAILYVWRYDAGDLSSLSYHLRHFSLEMTLRYTKDKEIIRLLGGEMFRLAARKTQAMLQGTVHPAGTFGKKLLRMVERLRPKIRLASDADMERQLLQLMKETGTALKANPWGFCACKAVPSNIRRAACQQKECRSGKLGSDGRPDHTGSDEVRCSGCLFFLTDETRRAHWKDAEQKIEAGLRKEINLAPLMRERLEKHLRKLQGFSSQAFVQRGRENE